MLNGDDELGYMGANKPASDPSELYAVQSTWSNAQNSDRTWTTSLVRDESELSNPLHSSDGVADELTVDLAFIDELRRIGETAGQDFLGELVSEFVHETDTLVVELRDALELKDSQRVGRIAHKIKGSAGQLGGRRLTSSCARLETAALLGAIAEDHADLHKVEVDYQKLRLALRKSIVSRPRF